MRWKHADLDDPKFLKIRTQPDQVYPLIKSRVNYNDRKRPHLVSAQAWEDTVRDAPESP